MPNFTTKRGNSAFLVTSCLLLLSPPPAVHAGLTLITSAADLNANDHIFWGHVGPSGTTTTDPFSIESYGGISVNVSQAGFSGFAVNTQVPYGSTPNNPIPNGFFGNFSPGDSVLSGVDGNGTGPLTLSFGSNVSAVGTQIEGFFPGAFTALVEAFDSAGNSLGSFTESGTVEAPWGDDSAIFLGVESTSQDIASVEFSLTSGTDDVAINQVEFASSFSVPGTYPDSGGGGGAVPEPSSLVLLAISCAGGLVAFRRKAALRR